MGNVTIATKTFGMMIDELTTTNLKIEVAENGSDAKSALLKRRNDIEIYITKEYGLNAIRAALNEIGELERVSRACFEAQDAIMDEKAGVAAVARAAKEAQRKNVERNKLIRAIDKLVGLESVTVTEKTYA